MGTMSKWRGVWGVMAAGVVSLLMVGGCGELQTNTRMAVLPFGAENPSVAGPKSLSDLTFGTYNVQGLSSVRRLKEDLAALSFVNAWSFQEVEADVEGAVEQADKVTPELRQRFNDIMPEGSWYGVYVPLNGRGGTWEGQAIVSRWPIVRAEVWPLEATGGKRRVALCAWLDTPAGTVRLVNTAHEAGSTGIGPEDRAKQVSGLVENLTKERASMTIVAGDFNTSGGWLGRGARGEIATLQEWMDKAGFAQVSSGRNETTFHAWPWYLSMDHIFLRDMACVEGGVYQGRASDHYPVWCRAVKATEHAAGQASHSSSNKQEPTGLQRG
jgi:endonuclease/exonuclease/phosphatase family metal-dependent hydrolase